MHFHVLASSRNFTVPLTEMDEKAPETRSEAIFGTIFPLQTLMEFENGAYSSLGSGGLNL